MALDTIPLDLPDVTTPISGDQVVIVRSGRLYGLTYDAPYWDLAGTVAPSVNEDTNATIPRSVGSRVYWNAKGLIFECLDATDGAAVWTRSKQGFGLVTGRWLPLFQGMSQVGTTAPDPTLIYVHPFEWHEKATITSLPVWVTTADAVSTGIKTAIYRTQEATTGYGRPIGAPLLTATGSAAATTGSGSTADTSGSLWPGAYWFAIKIQSTTARFHTMSSLDRTIERLIGRGVMSGSANAVQHLSTNGTSYATAFPTFTGSEVWTDVFGQGMPYGFLGY